MEEKTWTVGDDGFEVFGDLASILRENKDVHIGMTTTGDNTFSTQENMIQRIIDTGVDTSKTIFTFIVTTLASQFTARLMPVKDDIPLGLISKGKKQWIAASVHPWNKYTIDDRLAQEIRSNLIKHLNMGYDFYHRALILFYTINLNVHLPITFANTSNIDKNEPFSMTNEEALSANSGLATDNPRVMDIINRMYGFGYRDPVSFAQGTSAHNKTLDNPPNMTSYRYIVEDGRQARRWIVLARKIGADHPNINVHATQAMTMMGSDKAESEDSILADFGLLSLNSEQAFAKLRESDPPAGKLHNPSDRRQIWR
ncbi:hypothetical protein BJ878DRAFT_567392 [Calycina marina]|uniref:Uncharacterized protein n=1 Tax=Calycina marina TaxID=1763456 RepID=A0A9P8CGN3_9HELO|nr:hypothetical protein BJ878DRAFT_567392 [Calycina marina]